MTVSALAIGVNRILAAPKTSAAVNSMVFAVHPPHGDPVITVNRLYETKGEEGGDLIGLAITVYAKTVPEIEAIGSTLVEEIDDTSDFDFEGLVGITFIKASSDVTGYDADRALYFRTIEFGVAL